MDNTCRIEADATSRARGAVDQPRILAAIVRAKTTYQRIGTATQSNVGASGIMMGLQGLPRHRTKLSPEHEERVVMSLDPVLKRTCPCLAPNDPACCDICLCECHRHRYKPVHGGKAVGVDGERQSVAISKRLDTQNHCTMTGTTVI